MAVSYALMEDGQRVLLEDGEGYWILEGAVATGDIWVDVVREVTGIWVDVPRVAA